ncbi:tetratricopeptide (TPR) repeat protein [Catenuloplanes nepalensis]|uniref:Tetratricopeptide (TPR) repeat protein n=1 Tax=Catenuloplanes nepalensis TaxID=587533 RepID=A0ABT9N6J9_9ACTN|nr:XRE family transcriptional regulator [Catenuloplanes nepalensis]MDP9799328.1 tetratricopeptide (TPR) repeat protein [Catenuloplanes nepalensis]
MENFGEALKRRRLAAGFRSLRAIADKTGYDFGYHGQVERGDRLGSAEFAEVCDVALNAGGELLALFHGGKEADVRRRTLLGTLTGLAVTTTVSPLVTMEALRQGIGQAVDADHDDWQLIAQDYATDFYLVGFGELLQRIQTDLVILLQLMAAQPADRQLARAAGQMSCILAMILTARGERATARRWWATARVAADKSGDLDTKLLVGAYDAINALYDGRSATRALRTANETLALAGERSCAGTAGALACRAQALAMVGDADGAVEAAQAVERITATMPSEVASATGSVWGWPEHRMWHTQSWVYSRTGRLQEAARAQDHAVALYPASQARLRAQVEMHRASCIIQAGQVTDGLRHAADALDRLPADRHNELLHEMVRMVVATVPTDHRDLIEVEELTDRIPALPSA